ncbi:MAG: hypothetical protein R6X06_05095 [Gammaproteobacteria bacterium]
MHTWHHHISRYKAIHWLLVLVIMSLALLPMSLHIHHDSEATAPVHLHSLDLHIGIDSLLSQHHNDAGTIELAADVLVKKSSDQPLLLLLVGFLLLGRCTPAARLRRPGRQDDAPPDISWLHHTPPLRAPPRP